MEKKQTIGDPKTTGPISGGGAGGGGGQFNLPKAKPMYEIWRKADSLRPEARVSEARSLKGALRAIDRRDNEYGGYIHYKKKIGD